MGFWNWLGGGGPQHPPTLILDTTKVVDRASFIALVVELRQDLKHNSLAWEADDLESYLEALQGVATDARDLDESNPWRLAAELLVAASIYE